MSTTQTKTRGPNAISRAFLKYHKTHPEIYSRLVSMSKALNNRNKKCGIGTLFEVLRHDYALQGLPGAEGLNNNYRSRYARLIMAIEPELKGFFKVRKLGS